MEHVIRQGVDLVFAPKDAEADVAARLLGDPVRVIRGEAALLQLTHGARVAPLLHALEDDSGLNIEVYQALRDQIMWAIATYYPELHLTAELPSEAEGGPAGGMLGQRLIGRGLITDAQLQVALGQWGRGAAAWRRVMATEPYMEQSALFSLGAVPASEQIGRAHV